jgi:hypothetical protein
MALQLSKTRERGFCLNSPSYSYLCVILRGFLGNVSVRLMRQRKSALCRTALMLVFAF